MMNRTIRSGLIGLSFAGALAACNETDISVPRGTFNGPANPPVDIVIEQEDRIVQVNRPAIDVLFVIDNSCSMEQEQASLAANFPQFMNYFVGSGIDYHIGVISTDLVSGLQAGQLQEARGYRYIDENTVDPTDVFADMATVGFNGNWEERGRDAVFTALELRRDDPANQGFYRPDAGLELVFVSDEDDVSEILSAAEFLAWFENLKWSPERTNAHAIVTPRNIDTCPEGLVAGHDYLDLAAATEGTTYSICAPDWAPMLDSLGLATSGLRLEYFLSRLPVLDTLEVSVRTPGGVTLEFEECLAGDEIEDDACSVIYNPARNSIVFLSYEPEPSAEVLIHYTIRENFAGVTPTGTTGN